MKFSLFLSLFRIEVKRPSEVHLESSRTSTMEFFWENSYVQLGSKYVSDSLPVFPLVTSTNVVNTPQDFLTFSLTLLPKCRKSSWSYLVLVPSYWTWTNVSSQKKLVFLLKFLKNWSYDNFCHRNGWVTKFWSHKDIYNITWVTW